MQQALAVFFRWYSANIRRIVFYACCTILGIVMLERLLIVFSYEAHTAGIDNNFDYPIIRSLAGYSIYPNPSDFPYAVNPYAPLFFIICTKLATLLHYGANDTIAIYRISRMVCLLADTGTCILLFVMLRRFSFAGNPLALACTTVFFTIVSYLGYTINRADALFLLFFTATIFLLFNFKTRRLALHTLLLAILATVCIFSKQNGISLLLLVPTWLLVGRNYRAAAAFTLFTGILFAGMFLYFELVYSQRFFSDHIINALKNKIDPRWFYVYITKLIAPTYLTLPLLAALVVAVEVIAGQQQIFLKKLGVIFIIQLFFSTGLCFKWGSSLGYFNECFLLAFLLMAHFYTRAAKEKLSGLIHPACIYTFPAYCIFIFHMVAQLYFFFINSRNEARQKFTEQVQIANYIKKRISVSGKYVMDLSNPDFNFFKNLLYKEMAAPNMDAVACCTLPDSIFNYSGLTGGLNNGKIIFLIQSKTAPEQAKWGIDLSAYKPDTSFSNYCIYRFDASAVKQ